MKLLCANSLGSIARFVLLVIAMMAGQLWKPINDGLIAPLTEAVAASSAFIIQWYSPRILAMGNSILDPATGYSISIEAGCNGVEACIVLVAAMVTAKVPWSNRLAGVLIGIAAIQLLNLVRVVSLFYLGQISDWLFEFAHLYAWQMLIALDVLLVWILWLRWSSFGLICTSSTRDCQQP